MSPETTTSAPSSADPATPEDLPIVLSIDAGTTGVRTLAIDAKGTKQGWSYREFPQYFPEPGWVEHDALEIWDAVAATLAEVVEQIGDAHRIAAIGITNQRETTIVWDAHTGQPLHRALVWQDRRTAARCDELKAGGVEPLVRAKTGLVLDPYFSATKLEWLFTKGGVAADQNTLFGTVDSWILWKLTGGIDGGVHGTDPSNASRTLLYNIGERRWDDELCELFSVPATCLPQVLASSGRFGITNPNSAAGLAVPVSGIAGDQQASLFGQACFAPGATKNTYGTGSFVLMNVGTSVPRIVDGILTTVAWQIGDEVTYAAEGAIFVTGAAIKWLRDGLGLIEAAADTGPLAASVPDTGGVYLVPAFAGLGSPYWDPYARGTIVGLTLGTTAAHMARAVVEAMAYQTKDVIDAMTSAAGTSVELLHVDGGASVMDLLCQFQADLLGVEVRRPVVQETTAMGAAYLAGLAEGVWASLDDITDAWQLDRSFEPEASRDASSSGYEGWLRAVERSRGWSTT
jgi:glycerol kinase